jgi:hypothetical protein
VACFPALPQRPQKLPLRPKNCAVIWILETFPPFSR